MVYPTTFKDTLETLSEEFFEHGYAECAGDMFGVEMPRGARDFLASL
ncbi:MAG: hypothetical protein LBL45_05625 [Treponema sp.]|nr:hypothetical protein [Treponema sp.]